MGKVQSEHTISQSLLSSILPLAVVNELKRGRSFVVESISEVTVLFCELQVRYSYLAIIQLRLCVLRQRTRLIIYPSWSDAVSLIFAHAHGCSRDP